MRITFGLGNTYSPLLGFCGGGALPTTITTEKGPITIDRVTSSLQALPQLMLYEQARIQEMSENRQSLSLSTESSRDWHKSLLAEPRVFILGAKDSQGRFVGRGYLQPTNISGVGLLSTGSVLNAYRRLGVGKALLDAAMSLAKEQKYQTLITVSENPIVIQYLKGRGFREYSSKSGMDAAQHLYISLDGNSPNIQTLPTDLHTYRSRGAVVDFSKELPTS